MFDEKCNFGYVALSGSYGTFVVHDNCNKRGYVTIQTLEKCSIPKYQSSSSKSIGEEISKYWRGRTQVLD